MNHEGTVDRLHAVIENLVELGPAGQPEALGKYVPCHTFQPQKWGHSTTEPHIVARKTLFVRNFRRLRGLKI
jgi:hypothetical protein